MNNQGINNNYKVNKRKLSIAIHYFVQTAHVKSRTSMLLDKSETHNSPSEGKTKISQYLQGFLVGFRGFRPYTRILFKLDDLCTHSKDTESI